MKNLLLTILILSSLVACNKSSDFGVVEELNNEYSLVSDDVVWNIDEPSVRQEEDKEEDKKEEDKKEEDKKEDDKKEDDKKEDEGDKDIDEVACHVDIQITSAHKSKVAVHVRDADTIKAMIDELSDSHKEFVLDSASGVISYSENKISQTSIRKGLRLNVKEDIELKATSVQTDEVVIYANGKADIQFTSLKTKHLIIVASSHVKLRTTSFNVENATILVKQNDDKEQSICVRKTSAGSFDASLNSPANGSGLIISGGTSLRDVKINSLIVGDGSAQQAWRATSIKNSDVAIANQVSGKSQTSLKMTSLKDSSVVIEELSAEANVSVKATSIRSSKFLIENLSPGGTSLKTRINGCGDYRNGDFFLANSGAQEDIGSQCK